MKNNQPVTQRAIDYPADTVLVTTTDKKGIITYANADFIHISGFSEQELIGKSHNVVRHPDMPEMAFQDLWETIKAGKSWRHLVKNRAKNGDHYWVDAYVTPVYDGEEIIGYQSVRSKPTPEQIEHAEALYARMKQNPALGIPKIRKHWYDWPIQRAAFWFALIFAVIQLGVMGIHLGGVQLPLGIEWLMDIVGILLPIAWYLILRAVLKPLKHINAALHQLQIGNLRTTIHSYGQNEIGQVAETTRALQARLLTLIGLFMETGRHLASVSEMLANRSDQTARHMTQQAEQTDLVASAMNEMTATVQSVAHNAADTAAAVGRANQEATHGQTQIEQTHRAISDLSNHLTQTAQSINALKDQGNAIEQVVQLISGIADQTNLLALNAAIEAARAGEHGRGFAVVADEVRALAAKTQVATVDIRSMIDTLRAGIESTVTVVETGHRQMTTVKTQATGTEQSLNKISQAIDQIGDMATQIATATEEQSMVAEEMNRNVQTIRSQTDQAVQSSKENAALSVETADISSQIAQHLSSVRIGQGVDFEAMKTAHRVWKIKVRAYLDGNPDALDARAATDSHACALGQWYDRKGIRQFGHLPAIANLDRPHKALHATIARIIELSRSGKHNEAKALLPEIDRLSDEVVSLIEQAEAAALKGG